MVRARRVSTHHAPDRDTLPLIVTLIPRRVSPPIMPNYALTRHIASHRIGRRHDVHDDHASVSGPVRRSSAIGEQPRLHNVEGMTPELAEQERPKVFLGGACNPTTWRAVRRASAAPALSSLRVVLVAWQSVAECVAECVSVWM